MPQLMPSFAALQRTRQNTDFARVHRLACRIGAGGSAIVVQSMTNTDTADVAGTVQQVRELADAGSELVRITVNSDAAAAAVAADSRPAGSRWLHACH